MDTLHVQLVTPEIPLLSIHAEEVIVPGTEGDFGVLPDHAPFVSTIRPGKIDIFQKGVRNSAFVSGGVAEVNNNQCVVLVEWAFLEKDLDRKVLVQELQEQTRLLAEEVFVEEERVLIEERTAFLQMVLTYL